MADRTERYAALAGSYDALMEDGQYRKRAAFLDRKLRSWNRPVHTVLDLACGTGTIAWMLSRRGYRVIATDASEEMLTAALGKADRMGRRTPTPLFLHQSMPSLQLGEPVDAAVSTLDSLNYLLRERDLRETFRRVFRSLHPGGVFFFDVNTPHKLRRMDGQLNLDEREGCFCVWRTFFRPRPQICVWQVDLFRERPDGTWERHMEEHRERAWTEAQLRNALTAAGFRNITLTGDLSDQPSAKDEDRWMVCAEKPV